MTDTRRHLLTPEAQPTGVSYSEFIFWAATLKVFTVEDLCDTMGVSPHVAQRGITALLWHGICEDTGDLSSAGDPIISYVPLPPGPNEHPTQAPEWRTCQQDLVPPGRGLPIRLVDNTKRRNLMQGTGGTRLQVRNRDRAWEKAEQAKLDRAERQRQQRNAEKQGRVNKQKGKTRTFMVDRKGDVES